MCSTTIAWKPMRTAQVMSVPVIVMSWHLNVGARVRRELRLDAVVAVGERGFVVLLSDFHKRTVEITLHRAFQRIEVHVSPFAPERRSC